MAHCGPSERRSGRGRAAVVFYGPRSSGRTFPPGPTREKSMGLTRKFLDQLRRRASERKTAAENHVNSDREIEAAWRISRLATSVAILVALSAIVVAVVLAWEPWNWFRPFVVDVEANPDNIETPTGPMGAFAFYVVPLPGEEVPAAS